jgi:phospho-N-acetylmuramoyl-pentapeptide-transferase
MHVKKFFAKVQPLAYTQFLNYTPVKITSMLYTLALNAIENFPILNLFRYISFRSGGALLTSLMLCFLSAPSIIRYLASFQTNNHVREDLEHHANKKGTPSMGGMMILFAAGSSSLLWARLDNPFVIITLSLTLAFGLIGLVDDLSKLKTPSHKGLYARHKLFLQIIFALAGAYVIFSFLPPHLNSHIAFPFFKSLLIDVGWLFIPFAAFVIVGSSNAVNLTDGLDGLAIVPVILNTACFGFIAYLVGHAVYAEYLQIHRVPQSGELAVIAAAIIGSGMGFLWYNAPPAHIFMGDTGSLSLGAAIASMAIITKHEIVLAITGGLFVLEALSVIIQVTSFRLTGKRIFAMTPIHHHFEKKGWSEPTIVIRFWIISAVLVLIGLATLKLR